MPIHAEVLEAARRLCRERGNWTFAPEEVVRALPHLNESSVRTHIVSRCCVNAPKNHPHKWDYFRRVGRGRYEIMPAYRKEPTLLRAPLSKTDQASGKGESRRIAEAKAEYGTRRPRGNREVIHAVLQRDEGVYVAECLEVAVVTQGRTLDEVVSNLKEAIGLHLEGEEGDSLGLARPERLRVVCEISLTLNGAEA